MVYSRYRKRRFRSRRPMPRRRRRFRRYRRWARRIEKVVGRETKRFTADISWTPSSSTAGTTSTEILGNIIQGDAEYQRIGNAIRVKYLFIKGLITHDSSGNDGQVVRFMILRNKQQVADSNSINFAGFFAAGGPIVNNPVLATIAQKWHIIRDKRMQVRADKTETTFKMYIPLSFTTRYNGPAAGDIQMNGLYILAVSSQGTSNFPVVQFDYRIGYMG